MLLEIMTSKKTIIFGLLAIVILAGLVWYGSQNKEQLASQLAAVISDNPEEIGSESIGEFVLGSPEAPVTIIEYSSHFCGYCVDFHLQTMPLIMEKYIKTGQVKLIPRLLSPLELSIAVLCAQEQGSFWDFSHELFEHVQEIESIADIKAVAESLDLNQDDFNQCFNSEKYRDEAMKWFEQAQEAAITGTPTFFINDQQVVGHQPFAVFEEIIEQELVQ